MSFSESKNTVVKLANTTGLQYCDTPDSDPGYHKYSFIVPSVCGRSNLDVFKRLFAHVMSVAEHISSGSIDKMPLWQNLRALEESLGHDKNFRINKCRHLRRQKKKFANK
jgi:hypothetical protein